MLVGDGEVSDQDSKLLTLSGQAIQKVSLLDTRIVDAVVDDLDLVVDLANLVHSASAENADRVVVADVFHNFNVVWVLVSVWVFQS